MERSLWRHGDFRRLWLATTISQIGSQLTFLALPLVAVLLLDASPFEMGLLTAVGGVPALVAGLHAGAIVDRRRRRPVLVGADLGRAVALATVPLAWALGVLSMPLLYAVAALVGLLTLCFDVAYGAFLPSLVARDRLVDGNAKLELGRTSAEIAGPGLTGVLVQLLTAPVVLLLDALSYLVSAALIGGIRSRERRPGPRSPTSGLVAEIHDGLRVVLGDPRLRALLWGHGMIGFFNAVLEAVFVLYLARSLDIGPALLGAIFALGGVGFLVGSLVPGVVSRLIGVGPAIAAGVAVLALSDLLVPLASGPPWVLVPLLVAAQFTFGLGLTVFKVNQTSVRQALVAAPLLGRAVATAGVVAAALVPLGALLGGVLGEVLGVRETLVIASVGELAAACWLGASPLRTLRELPVSPQATGAA